MQDTLALKITTFKKLSVRQVVALQSLRVPALWTEIGTESVALEYEAYEVEEWDW